MGWGSYLFVHLKMGGCIKLCNHFLGAMCFCAFQFPFHKKETINTEGINNKSNIIYYQNDGITNQHNMVYISSPFTLEEENSCIIQYYSVSLCSNSLFEGLIVGKYSLISVQA